MSCRTSTRWSSSRRWWAPWPSAATGRPWTSVEALSSPAGARPPLPTTSPEDTSLSLLSVLDWIGVLVVGGSGLLSLTVPLLLVPMYRRLSESLGATGPSFAGAVLQGWMPAALGLFPLALLVYALAVPQPLMRRRMVLVLAFALTVLASAVILIALYSKLFNLAGAATGP